MTWVAPKTNWATTDGVALADLNRIEGNTLDIVTLPTSTGTTAIVVPIPALVTGMSRTFIAGGSNGGAATTVNGLPLYKPTTLVAPTIIAGKAYTIYYNLTGNCFFLQMNAEGSTIAGHVIAGDTFSNDVDIALVGTLALTGSAVAANILAGTTAYTTNPLVQVPGAMVDYNGQNVQASSPWNSGTTLYFPVASDGHYTGGGGSGLKATDANFVPTCIANNKSIFGVTGTFINKVLIASDVIAWNSSATVSSYVYTPTLVGSLTVHQPGTIRVKWDTQGATGSGAYAGQSFNGYSQLYKNGVAYSAQIVAGNSVSVNTVIDVPVAVGDVISWYTWAISGSPYGGYILNRYVCGSYVDITAAPNLLSGGLVS